MTAALEMTRVAADLGGRPVLRDVDVRVDTGQFTALLGPNGAGKTTLMRAALGLIPLRAGTVTSGSAGYVPQRHEFTWDFPASVQDAVLSGLVRRIGLFRRPGVAHWQAVWDALDRVRLTDLRKRPVGELSGGQRQRVLVARALVLEPAVLLLDEPFTGLDMPAQETLTDLFADIARERAVLMATHDLTAAAYTCDRLILLNRTVIAAGPPSDLKDPEVWMRTFDVGPGSHLLKALDLGGA
ncbi:anchored repeat-type ABC transporter ATP-binding subunit [Actinoplanes philippinensis]|uniref:Manganese/iron transport system ATP-binding protein n=1 Tax=Actinoplanes philippinensis TaxID=35752 RepID=A0A1I2KEJ3_9ACTN|nr:anchored repeat-type ABC transporter ATP-binding subunit [Actinoplanes philippinensis]GIE82015.1 anchored repeat-type ABC transporter ATP-binding subunit [Actinoplanes philippinensis]SFF65465.1 manganese/iron transport system ATP-binding protein [Actinoplanes philippinensis]